MVRPHPVVVTQTHTYSRRVTPKSCSDALDHTGKNLKKKVENKITFVSFFKKSPDALGLYTTTFSARIPFPESFLLCDDLDANLNVPSV